MSMLLSDLLSPSAAPPGGKSSGSKATNPTASEQDSFRQSFAKETQKWDKTPAGDRASAAPKPAEQSPRNAKAEHAEAATKADPNRGKAASEAAGESAAEENTLPETDETAVALVAPQTVATQPAVEPVKLHAASLRADGAAGDAQPGRPLTGLSLVETAAVLNEPAQVTANALAAGKSPAMASPLQATAAGLLNSAQAQSGGPGKAVKLDNWQLSGIEGAIAAQLDRPESGANLTNLSAMGLGQSPGLMGDAAGARLQIPVTVTFGQPQWAQNIAERSAMLFSQNIDSAELQLDPPELGRVNVQIQVHNNDQASVTFTSANPNVREALDQSSQRLRDLLAEQGLDLVDVDVSDQKDPEQRDAPEGDFAGSSVAGEPDPLDAAPASVQTVVNQGVDHYV